METGVRDEEAAPEVGHNNGSTGQEEEGGEGQVRPGDSEGLADEHDGARSGRGLGGAEEVVECPEGVDPVDHADIERIKQARFLFSQKPDFAIEQAFYLIKLGSDVILNALEMGLSKFTKELIQNQLQDCQNGIKYMHIKAGQLETISRLLKQEAKGYIKELIKRSKVIEKAMRERPR